MVTWTKWLTGATCLLGLFTAGLWVATRRVVVDGREVFIHAQQSSEKQLRPYVFMETRAFPWLHAPHDDGIVEAYRVVLIWKNMGQTPARKAVATLSAKGFLGELPAEYDFPDLIAATPVGTIGPGGTITSFVNVPLAEFGTPELRLNVHYWGWIEYDGFDGSGRHRTEICAMMIPDGDPGRRETVFVDAFKTTFNGSDKDCRYKPKT